MEDQQKLQQILAQLEVYKSQSELYQTQIDAVQTSLAEIRILESTLDDISGKDTVETLVPLGAGSFINAEIKNENKVIMSLGSGVAVSKTFEEAKETTAEQMDKLFADLQQITNIVAQLSPQAEQLMQKLQSQGRM